ncbi:hypothetical protein ABPG74_012822 [Tetrahymena malaccensis]
MLQLNRNNQFDSQPQQQSQFQQNIELANQNSRLQPPQNINIGKPDDKEQPNQQEKQIKGEPKKIHLPSDLKAQNRINLTQLVKSDFYSDLDRKADYEEITSEIRKEGFFGLSKILMEEIDDQIIARKAILEGRSEQEQKGLKDELLSKNRPKSEMDDLQKKDGLYVTDQSQWLYLLEEQLQKQRMKDNDRFLLKFFKKNGDLVIDQEFFDEKISKIRVISQRPNQSLAIKRRPAVMCERLNQNKHIPYRLRIYVGKIQITKHFKMVTEEISIQELIQKVNEYKQRCDLALIPHYDQAIKVIENEIAYLEHSAMKQPKKQIAILENERNKLQRLVADEANLIKGLIDDIIERWKQIQINRQTLNRVNNPIKLYAKQYRNADNGQEIEFVLVKDNYTDDKEVDRSEVGRRNTIRKEKIFVQLLVNGQEAGQSQAYPIDWPSFEVKIMEQFYILLFTRPKSMQLRIVQSGVVNKVIDVIDLEIPGDKSKTITATSQVLSEVEFCQGQSARRAQKLQEIENEKKKLLQKAKQDEIAREQLKKQEMMMINNKKKAKKDENEEKQQQEEDPNKQNVVEEQILTPQQLEEKRKEEEKKMIQQKMEQLQQQEQKARDSATHRGKVSVLCEWTGQGDKMPPHNIDNFGKGLATNQDLMLAFKDPNDEVNKIIEDFDDDGFHFDVNDPRNELQIEKLRNLRFKDQRAKVLRDIFLPFAHIESLRERLIKCSLINPDITYIPMKEDEIYNNTELLKLLEKTEQGLYLQEELLLEEQKDDKKHMFLENVAITTKEVFEYQKVETKKRIENIKRILLKRQKFALLRKQNNKDGAPLTLKNVVNEYIIGENEIVIFELIKQCFTQQRRLQPKKKKEEKIRLQDIKDGINILFHVSHGTNVPLRDDDKTREQINALIKTRTGQMMMPQYGQFGQFGQFGMGQMQMMEPQKMVDQNMMKNEKRVDFKNLQDLERVNSFIQIKLVFEKQEYFIESKPFEGNNPEWSSDRSLFLPQFQNKKLSNYELFDSSNRLIVTLFDKRYIRRFGRENKKKQIKTEHDFFLGSVSIPLYTLFQNQKFQATFRLSRPIIILGYYSDSTSLLGLDQQNMNPLGQEIRNSKVRIDPSLPTTVSLSIHIDPFIEVIQENDDIFYGDGQDQRLEYYSVKWLEDYRKNKNFAKRHVKIFGNDIEQNSFYLPRYLTKLAPPNLFSQGLKIDHKDLKSDLHAIEKAARFVSLIPFKNDTELFKDIPDVHCDSQQFLDLKGGDFEEHAFLLCNYFNYIDYYSGRINYKSYVILGHAIPEGKTFYVLRRDCQNNKVEIWNPSTGEPFVMTTELKGTTFMCFTIGKNKQSVIQRYDKACPLYDVGCVIDEKNIYANIQPSGAPGQIEWNIENPKLWRPFLTDKYIETMYGEQGIEPIYKNEEALQYEVTPQKPIDQLAITIQNYIQNRITELRGVRVNVHQEYRSIIKDQLLVQLESMKYRLRFFGQGTELSNQIDNINPLQQNPLGGQGFPGAPPGQGFPGQGSLPNEQSNDQKRKFQSAIQTLEQIQSQFEEFIPATKQLYGFPLNIPFTSIEKVWEEIKQTGIHEILKKDIEYLLDTKCYCYPNFIISVWVFVGVIYED